MSERVRRGVWVAGWPARFLLLTLVRAYRVTLGKAIGGNCRFHPSCSAYAEMAISRSGALKGTGLAVWRVLRCSPFTTGGVDYPPGAGKPGTLVYENNILAELERKQAPRRPGAVA